MLEPKDKNGNYFIIEFKVLDNLLEATIEETIKNAKKQIVEKNMKKICLNVVLIILLKCFLLLREKK